MENIYSASKRGVFRTPIFSLENYFELFANQDETKKYIEKLKNNDVFREILSISSNDLITEIDNGSITNDSRLKLLYSCIKYAIRSSTRCTPFGLCAGVSIVSFAESTDLKLNAKSKSLKYVRPDMEWLLEVINKIESNDNILENLKICFNSYVYPKGNRLVNPWKVGIKTADTQSTMISIRNSKLMELIMNATSDYILYKDLKKLIKKEYSNVTEEKIENFLKELLVNEYLMTELSPIMINNQPLQQILDILKNVPIAQKYYLKLNDIQNMLHDYAQCDIGKAGTKLNDICNCMKDINKSKNYIQVDLKKAPLKTHLSEKIPRAAQEFLDLLCQIADYEYEPNHIINFKSNFIEKYGFNVAIPILEVFDNDQGIGAPAGYMNPQTKQQLVFYSQKTSKFQKYLLYKVQEAIKLNHKEVRLIDAELTLLKTNYIPLELLPKSVELCLEVIADDEKKIDEGNFQIIPTGFVATESAGKSFGRFAYMFSKEIEEQRTKRIEENSEFITAELVEYPLYKRNCNIMLCNTTSKYQLHMNTPKSLKNNYLSISDVCIGLDSNTNGFYFKSAKLNKRIVFTSNNLFNPILGSNIFRFLKENSELTCLPIVHAYNLFQTLDLPYTPRIVYKRIVISPAMWKIPYSIKIEDIIDYKQMWGIPDMVYLVQGDNKLLLNLKNKYHLQLLLNLNKNQSEDIMLLEAIGIEDSRWLKDIDHESYKNELVLSFHKNNYEVIVAQPEISVLETETEIKDVCPSFYTTKSYCTLLDEGWVYLKMYCDSKDNDEIIGEEIYRWCEYLSRKKKIEQYFFVRYSDSENHIRLRMKMVYDSKDVLNTLLNWQKDLQKNYFISKFQIDTYHREIQRYGGEHLIKYAEEVFYRDSQVIAEILNKKKIINVSEDLFGILNILSIAYAYGLSDENLEQWLSQTISPTSYRKQFQERRIEILEMIDLFFKKESMLNDSEFIDTRTKAIASYKEQIDISDKKGTLTSSKADILSSIIHMSMNRFKGNNSWEQKIRALTRNGLYAYCQMKKHYK